MINEAAFIKMEGVSDIAGIDAAMKLGANHPMGPLELGDFIGLDICLAIMDVLYNETGDSKYRACPLLRKMVRGGNLGCKSGKGFYIGWNFSTILFHQGFATGNNVLCLIMVKSRRVNILLKLL
jgi:3-hydroxyacyl-CoA dehydrogenase